MQRTALLILALLLGLTRQQPSGISGVVFEDANANGVRDSGERGIANVLVSNQDTVVVTDASGAFRMSARGTGVVFVSTPNDYRAVGAFWRDANAAAPIAFALAKLQPGNGFSFIHASDTHISKASLARTQRMRAIVDSVHADLLLISGDLVRDALRVGEAEATGYYEMFMNEYAAFKEPVFTVPGNHENFGIERDTSHVSASHPLYGRGMYHHFLGPDYYSFTRGGVHFIGLNTVDIDDQHYYGHVDSLQLAWLARDLALVPANMPVVTFDHIPFFSTFEGINGYMGGPPAPSLITIGGKTSYRHTVSNAAEVLAVLRKKNHVLALGGHIHGTEKIEYEIAGVKTRFNQISATVGGPRGAGLQFTSGVELYRVNNGVIDAGKFIPIDPPR